MAQYSKILVKAEKLHAVQNLYQELLLLLVNKAEGIYFKTVRLKLQLSH